MSDLTDTEKATKLRRIWELLGWRIDHYGGENLSLSREIGDVIIAYGHDITGYALRVLWKRHKRQVRRGNPESTTPWVGEQWEDGHWWVKPLYAPTELDCIIDNLEHGQAKEKESQAARPADLLGDGVDLVGRLDTLEERICRIELALERANEPLAY